MMMMMMMMTVIERNAKSGTTDLPANDDESADEQRDVDTHNVREPLNVAADIRRHVAVEPPQLCDWTLRRTLITHSSMLQRSLGSGNINRGLETVA